MIRLYAIDLVTIIVASISLGMLLMLAITLWIKGGFK